MKVKGVLDRITDGKYGTIIAEEVGKEFVINITNLPDGVKEGDWLNLEIQGDKITKISINREQTESREASIANKMAQLKKRSGSKFKK